MSPNDETSAPSVGPSAENEAPAPLSTDPHPSAETSERPRDSKGWDGKLRVNKEDLNGGPSPAKPLITNPEALSDPEYSDEENVLEGEEIQADEDLLEEYDDDEDEINLVHCRISSIPALRLERFTKLQKLCLRQNQISAVEFPSSLGPLLQELDLYDNAIAHIKGLEDLTELTSLDLSFNKIKHIKRLEALTKLRDIYFVQNKIQAIEGLETLTNLRNLELGANRIREIQGLETLTGLEELWLGKNKITEIKGLDTLSNLTILSIQSNRLTSIKNISHLQKLEQLHISHNALTSLEGIENNANLSILDISNNPIESLSGLGPLKHLSELWASYCQVKDIAELERELADKEELDTVYFEGNPLQTRQKALYRNKVRLALPRVKQIDATFVRVE